MRDFRKVMQTVDGELFIIRRVKGTDAGNIIDCINKVGSEKIFLVIEKFSHTEDWERNYIENLDKNYVFYIAAEVKNKIVGMLSIEREKYAKLNHVATLGMVILKNYRNKGIGSGLLNSAIQWANQKNIEKICLSCFSTNKAAISLYEKFGFREEGRRKNQFKVGTKYVDEVMMAKWI